jgi:hypothetical protein
MDAAKTRQFVRLVRQCFRRENTAIFATDEIQEFLSDGTPLDAVATMQAIRRIAAANRWEALVFDYGAAVRFSPVEKNGAPRASRRRAAGTPRRATHERTAAKASFKKQWLGMALAALCGFGAMGADEAEKVTFYVQLIRGSDAEERPTPECKPVGPKLSAKLRPVFHWKHYWEINRQQVALAHGGKARVRLSKERDVEIDLGDPAKRKVTAFKDGKPVARATRSAGDAMTVIGGERDGDTNTAWFIIVRRDKPSE